MQPVTITPRSSSNNTRSTLLSFDDELSLNPLEAELIDIDNEIISKKDKEIAEKNAQIEHLKVRTLLYNHFTPLSKK